jgi:hypothetical protein
MQTHLGVLQSIARHRASASRSRTVAARLRAIATPGGATAAQRGWSRALDSANAIATPAMRDYDVDPVHCESRGRMREGVCSTFLAERADKGHKDQLLSLVTPAVTPAKEKTR